MAISATNAATTTDTGRTTGQALGQKEFLKLLATQMTQQDPLNPMKDTEFIAQLAQFTSLEQAKNTSQSVSMLQATGMMGRQVTLRGDTANSQIQGVVTGVSMNGDKPTLNLEGDSTNYDLSRVLAVSTPPPEQSLPAGVLPVQTAAQPHVPAPASWLPPKLASILNP